MDHKNVLHVDATVFHFQVSHANKLVRYCVVIHFDIIHNSIVITIIIIILVIIIIMPVTMIITLLPAVSLLLFSFNAIDQT